MLLLGAAFISCSKSDDEPTTPNEPNNDTTLEYGGVSYKTVTYNGVTWMAENLRYVPEGMTISSDGTDGSGLWYPYEFDSDGNAVAITDNDEMGLIYNFATAIQNSNFALTEENSYDDYEGLQGICPDGWHIPTYDDWFALCGQALSASDDTTAPFYNADGDAYGATYASIIKANEAGFNFQFTGSVISSKYNTTAVKELYTSTTSTPAEKTVGDLSFVGLPAISYYMCSSGRSTSGLWGMMSTFAYNNIDGKFYLLNVSLANGQALRCVKDSE